MTDRLNCNATATKAQVVSQGVWTLQCHLESKPEARHLHSYINQSRDARFAKGEEREHLIKKPLPQRARLEMDTCVDHQPIGKIMSSVLKGDLIDVPGNPLAITKVKRLFCSLVFSDFKI